MFNMMKLVVGDWSNDGHGMSEFVYFNCNMPEHEVKKAYLEAVAKCGVGLHDPRKGEDHVAICSEYEERTIPLIYKEQLEKAGVDFSIVGGIEEAGSWCDFSEKAIAQIFLQLVKTVRPDFKYEIVNDQVPCINGFWSKDFNLGFGYGVFS